MSEPTQFKQDSENPQPGAFVGPKFDLKSPTNETKDKKHLIPFPIWTAADFTAYEPPPDRDILGKAILRQGNLTLLMGQAGLGKSTAALALAIANVRGDLDFAGLPLSPKPRRWLFIGNENGADRWKEHFEAANKTLTPEQQAVLEQNVHVAALFEDENPDLSLPDQEGRLEATVRTAQADVVVLDPWTEIVPNEVDSGIVRDSIASLKGAIRRANPHAAILVICHAKSGRDAATESLSNFNGGKVQRGNGMLYNSARAAILLTPYADQGSDLIISVIKCNDGPKPEPKHVVFQRDEFRYKVKKTFIVNASVGRMNKYSKKPRAVEPETIKELVNKGHTETNQIIAQLHNVASSRTIKEAISISLNLNMITKVKQGVYAPFVGPPNEEVFIGSADDVAPIVQCATPL